MRPDFRLLMPADAGMPTDIDAWQPLRFDLATGARDQQVLRVVARLAPGATIAAAQQEMDRIAERHRAEHPFHENMGIHVVVRPMAADVVEGVRPVLLALLGAVGFVLLIACFNVANLMLARSAVRGRETAVRAALGAGRWRIARQVLAEGVVLAVAGGLAGVGLAWAGLRALLALRPPDLPRVDEVGLDPAVLAVSCGVTLAAALLCSLLPALELSGTRPYQALKEGGAGASRRLRLRGALVVAEVALSLVLLVGAGLMMRSFLELQRVRPGFEPEGAVAYNLSLPFATYEAIPPSQSAAEREGHRHAVGWLTLWDSTVPFSRALAPEGRARCAFESGERRREDELRAGALARSSRSWTSGPTTGEAYRGPNRAEPSAAGGVDPARRRRISRRCAVRFALSSDYGGSE